MNIQLTDYIKNNLITSRTDFVCLSCTTLSIFMINGSTTTMGLFAQAQAQSLPTCTDPTNEDLHRLVWAVRKQVVRQAPQQVLAGQLRVQVLITTGALSLTSFFGLVNS